MTGRWKNGDCGEDLYCKLGAFTINVPPLRKRRDEIIVLMHHLMHRLWRQYGLAARTFSPALSVRAEITPGRKTSKSLRPFVKRYLVVGDKDLPHNGIGNDLTRIREGGALLPPKPRAEGNGAREVDPDKEIEGGQCRPKSLKSIIQTVKSEAEKNAIEIALQKTRWNRKAAARLLQVSYRALLYKMISIILAPPCLFSRH